jgi:serine/threonine protein phosphatase PrpC
VAAQLTDVGRKRERNQDNVTHFIPSDQRTLDEKGALFIVCDGMGGHAAGEVAAELGVTTIRDAYYAMRGEDIVSSLAQAVDQANQAIYQRAREHPELAGMGTTCVAVAVTGGRAYFVNIGDSRGYLLRDGQLRQVTRDHSWVAEQVRAGVLTPEQARTHLHRNVITRSLGTQPTVSADLFVETLRDDDRVLLCSDGLHGYVDERQIERTVLGEQPEMSVHHLIDIANSNGGPDNITAVVVHLLQVPEPAGEITLPIGLMPSPTPPASEMTQPLPLQGTAPSTAPMAAATSAAAGGRAASSASATMSAARAKKRAGRSRGRSVALSLVAVLALALVGGAAWYTGFGPNAHSQAADHQLQQDITSAQQVIQGAASQPPAEALTALGQARATIESDLRNGQLGDQTRQQGQALLTGQLEPAVRAALQRYNAAARVTPITGVPLTCTIPNATDDAPLTSITALTGAAWTPPTGSALAGAQLLYLLHAGALYAAAVPLDSVGTPQADRVTCGAESGLSLGTIVTIAADGATLYTLGLPANGGFTVSQLTVSGTLPSGLPALKAQTLFSTPTGAATPTHLAVRGSTAYLSFTGNTGTGAGVWIYDTRSPKNAPITVALPKPATALASAENALYLLLNDGSLAELDSGHTYRPLPVNVLTPVQPADPNAYAIGTPVPTPVPTQLAQVSAAPTPTPTPTPGTGTPTAPAKPTSTPTETAPPMTTLFPTGSALAVSPGSPAHLLVGDGTNARVVGLNGSTAGPGLAPAAQFVYSAASAGNNYLAVAQHGDNLTIFAWNGTALQSFLVPVSALQQ